jgi:acetate kinase
MARILTINSGSSSIKFSLYVIGEQEQREHAALIDRIGLAGARFQVWDATGSPLVERPVQAPDHAAALMSYTRWYETETAGQPLDAVGHRVVHGGTRFSQPSPSTADLLATLERLAPLAPDHLPHEIAAIRSCQQAFPSVPNVACFDTAFHRTMPAVAQRFPLPERFAREGVVRYGFHGLSCEYIVGELAHEGGDRGREWPGHGRLIIAHLGNGASMTAVRDGQSIDTTMGFTPTGGLVMSTRTGDLDPGVLLYLLESGATDVPALRALVTEGGGLLGVSGTSSDMRDLLEREATDPRAALAVALFCYTARKQLAGLAGALGGLDRLVFTGGIGEHAPAIRARICDGLAFLGIHLDATQNSGNARAISAPASTVTVQVIPTNEELIIARHTYAVLESAGRVAATTEHETANGPNRQSLP